MSRWRRLPIATLLERADGGELHRHMGLWALTLMGVGGTIGSGIFVLTGIAAAQYAGPGIAISFVIAGVACLLAGLCYAELASAIPVAGSAYTYAYATMGEFIAWIIGWNLVLEYLFATSAVAVGWSSYFLALLAQFGLHLPPQLADATLTEAADGRWMLSGAWFNLPAAAVVLFISAILSMGMRKSSLFNSLVVALKVGIILLVIGFGAVHVDPANWRPFVPANAGAFGVFGWSGVLRGAGVAFFSYIGFDMVSSSAQEVKDPRRTLPLGLLLTLGLVTLLYVAMALVQTGLAPYRALNVADPVLVALQHGGRALSWLTPYVSVSVVVGLLAAIFLGVYGQSRIFYSMAKDGLIPPAFARIDPRTRTPSFSIWFVGLAAAAVASFVPLQVLGDLVSIGTLMAFAIVCIGVLVLRRTNPDLPRTFRTPFVGPVAVIGAAVCVCMMVSLPPPTWVRLAVWVALGLIIYFAYGARHSSFAERPAREPNP